jgi:uncharacterized protein
MDHYPNNVEPGLNRLQPHAGFINMKRGLTNEMSGLAEELLREAMEKMDATTTHDPQHTERVYRIATRMALMEGADLELVQVAAALHDIGRPYGEPHAEVGAVKAAEILRLRGYPEGRIESVRRIILKHSFSGRERPKTLEERIIWDADKIDGFGAIGIARAFHMQGEKRKPFNDFAWFDQITRLQYEALSTRTGKEIAKERFRFMEAFFRRLNDEIEAF